MNALVDLHVGDDTDGTPVSEQLLNESHRLRLTGKRSDTLIRVQQIRHTLCGPTVTVLSPLAPDISEQVVNVDIGESAN